jgi:predicted transcriptional regulator
MQVSDEQLLAKMRSPVHINFIAHMLRSDKEEAMERIKSLISQGLVVESHYANNYYVVKNIN